MVMPMMKATPTRMQCVYRSIYSTAVCMDEMHRVRLNLTSSLDTNAWCCLLPMTGENLSRPRKVRARGRKRAFQETISQSGPICDCGKNSKLKKCKTWPHHQQRARFAHPFCWPFLRAFHCVCSLCKKLIRN